MRFKKTGNYSTVATNAQTFPTGLLLGAIKVSGAAGFFFLFSFISP
jgi:hypothetical protein